MNERLLSIRKFLKLSQEEFGRRLGVTGTSISRLESGERNITDQMLLAVCREFNISEEWFKTGIGKMVIETGDRVISQLTEDFKLDDFSIRALKAYQKLDDQGKKAIQQYVSFLVSESSDTDCHVD